MKNSFYIIAILELCCVMLSCDPEDVLNNSTKNSDTLDYVLVAKNAVKITLLETTIMTA